MDYNIKQVYCFLLTIHSKKNLKPTPAGRIQTCLEIHRGFKIARPNIISTFLYKYEAK